MGLLEKNRCKNLFAFVQKYDPIEVKTHGGEEIFKQKYLNLI